MDAGPESITAVPTLLRDLKFMHLFWGSSIPAFSLQLLLTAFGEAGYKYDVSVALPQLYVLVLFSLIVLDQHGIVLDQHGRLAEARLSDL